MYIQNGITLEEQQKLLMQELQSSSMPSTTREELQGQLESSLSVQTELASSVSASAQKVKEENAEQRELLKQIALATGQEYNAKDQKAYLEAQVATDAIQRQRTTLDTYNDTVGSDEAKARRESARKRYSDAELEYQQKIADWEQKGFLGKLMGSFDLHAAKTKRDAAAQALKTRQSVVVAAKQSLAQSLVNDTVAAKIERGEQTVEVERNIKVAQNLMDKLNKDVILSKEEISTYASDIGVDIKVMDAEVKKLQILKEKRLLSSSDLQETLTKLNAVTVAKRIEDERKNAESADVFNNTMTGWVDEFLSTGEDTKELIGKLSYEELAKLPQTDPLKAKFNQWMMHTKFTSSKFADAQLKALDGKTLNNAEQQLMVMGRKATNLHNSTLNSEIDKLMAERDKNLKSGKDTTLIDAQIAGVQAQKLDAEALKDAPRIGKLIRDLETRANYDTTNALAVGAIVVDDYREVINGPATETSQKLKAMLSPDAIAILGDTAFEDMDVSIDPANPSGSVNATLEQAIIGLTRKLAELPDDGTIDETSTALLTQTSNALASIYKANRELSTRSNGLTSINNLVLPNIKTFEPTTWFSAESSTGKLNLENAGEIEMILSNKLRMRTAKRNRPNYLNTGLDSLVNRGGF